MTAKLTVFAHVMSVLHCFCKINIQPGLILQQGSI